MGMKAKNQADVTAAVVFKAIGATIQGVTEQDCRSFKIVKWTPARRRLSFSEPSHRALAGGTAEVKFEVVQSLGASGFASAGDFSAAVSTKISAAVSSGSMTSGLATVCGGGCGIEATSSAVILVPLNNQPYPTKSPTKKPAGTSGAAFTAVAPSSADGGDGAAASATIIALAAALVVALGLAAYLFMRQRSQEQEHDKPDKKNPAFELAPTPGPSKLLQFGAGGGIVSFDADDSLESLGEERRRAEVLTRKKIEMPAKVAAEHAADGTCI